MDNLWNEQTQIELENLKTLKKKLVDSKEDISVMGVYLITIAELEGINLIEEEKEYILKFFQEQTDAIDQITLFKALEYAKYFNYLNSVRLFTPKSGFSIKNFLKKMQCIREEADYEQLEEFILTKEINKVGKFGAFLDVLWTKITKNSNLNNPLTQLIEKLSPNGFTFYQGLLEYIFNIEFIIQEEDRSWLTRSTFKKIKNKSKRFLSPINDRITTLEKWKNQKELEERKIEQELITQKTNRQKIYNIIDSNKDCFIELTSKIKKCFTTPELEEEALTLIIQHNERIITEAEKRIQDFQNSFNDVYELALIDFEWSIPEKKILDQIRKTIPIEEFKKILKELRKKEFSFLTPEHPLFLHILQNTNDATLKELEKETKDLELPFSYLANYPQILMTTELLQFKKNKELALKNNLQIAFFLNSDILLKDSELVQKTMDLIKIYHCETLPFYGLDYFDQIDSLIEKRFHLNPNIPEIIDESTIKVQIALQNKAPLSIENMEDDEEIKWLDEQFKLDSLRYCINGLFISRIKVMRYLKALNEYVNKPSNLQNAILYNTHFFEFERQELIETLNKNWQRKRDYPKK